MRAWPVIVLGLGLLGYLIFRVEALEARLEEVSRIVEPTSAEQADTEHEDPGNLGDRMRALETEAEELRHQLARLSDRVDPALEDIDEEMSDMRILDVVEQENNRIRDRQLEFHRDRWLQHREAALANFSQTFGLTPWQHQQVQTLISRELDAIVEILKSKEARENPEQALSDWQAMLEETDESIKRILEEQEQLDAWYQARAIERAVFMPWLPETPKKEE